jgi:hypothetical protein
LKLKPSNYVTAAESAKPGYLARRMKAYAAEEAKRQAQKQANQAEAQEKVIEFREAHGR